MEKDDRIHDKAPAHNSKIEGLKLFESIPFPHFPTKKINFLFQKEGEKREIEK